VRRSRANVLLVLPCDGQARPRPGICRRSGELSEPALAKGGSKTDSSSHSISHASHYGGAIFRSLQWASRRNGNASVRRARRDEQSLRRRSRWHKSGLVLRVTLTERPSVGEVEGRLQERPPLPINWQDQWRMSGLCHRARQTVKARGGAESASNMQWQTQEAAKAKDSTD
jgi:hypothetical protein